MRFVMGWTRTNDPEAAHAGADDLQPADQRGGTLGDRVLRPVAGRIAPDVPDTGRRAALGGHAAGCRRPGARRVVGEWRALRDGEGRTVYDFDRAKFKPEDVIQPKSRTFIPARVTDNPYYTDSGYVATLQSLPEPLRSQMLYGDFRAGIKGRPVAGNSDSLGGRGDGALEAPGQAGADGFHRHGRIARW